MQQMLKLLRPRLRRRLPRPQPSLAQQAVRDTDAFLLVARQSFVRLQQAWDAADLAALSSLTTDQLLLELRDQLAARPPGANCTEVVSLDARLLSIEDLRDAMVASVEFTGVIREHVDHHPAPFRELWLLANLKGGSSGWRLARVQTLS